MLQSYRPLAHGALLVLALCINVALYLLEPSVVKALRNQLFDSYQQWRPRPYQDVGVRIIDIDDASLQKLGQWPWPRSKIANFVQQLQDTQLRALAFDVLFAEEDRTSPQHVGALWNPSVELQAQLNQLPDHDQLLAAALHKVPSVLGFAAQQQQEASRLPQLAARFITIGASQTISLPQISASVPALPVLEQNAQGNGGLVFLPDIDGLLRRVPLLIQLPGAIYPSLALEIIRVAGQQKNVSLQVDSEGKITQITSGNHRIPTQANAEMWLYNTRHEPSRTIPIWKIIQQQIPVSSLQHKILLVGTSAKGLEDLRYSPVNGLIPGVEVHAQAVEQILSQTYLLRPAWAATLELLLVVCGSISVAYWGLTRRIKASLLYSASVVLVLMGSSWAMFCYRGWLIDSLTPSLMILSVFMLSSFIHHSSSEKRQRWIREVFSRYVSPNLVNYLIEHPETVTLSAQRRECSFVMTDLAGSTAFMENTSPEIVADCLNTYLDRMIAVAFAWDGTLTRIIGDGLVIVFSAPVPQPDHRERAIQCALAMQQFAADYNAELERKGIAFCDTRIGVNTGMVLIGNFGGNTLFDYRALGDPINTAARLESANRYLGTDICIAESCLSADCTIPLRPIGRLLLKGKSKPLQAYEPINLPEAIPGYRDNAYEEAYQLMTENPEAALQAFTNLAATRPQDKLVAFHLARLQQGNPGDLIIFTEK